MKLVVGFGNPGAQYNFSRHNLGFLALDFYFKKKGWVWEKTPKNDGIWRKVSAAEARMTEDVVFLKPQTFYNDSGRAVAAFLRFYKMSVEGLLVVCDDFTMEFGKLRLRKSGSDGGSNGLKSVIRELGTSEFARLKVGTGNAELRRKIGDTNFVLGKFLPEEKEKLPGILTEVEGRIDEFCRGD